MKFFMLINLRLVTIANSFLLNIAEHENFSANKYENANFCWQPTFVGSQLLLAFSYLLEGKISCSAELSTKKSFLTFGPDQTVQMHRLIWSFAVGIRRKTRFHMV